MTPHTTEIDVLRARLAAVEKLAAEWEEAEEPDGGVALAPVVALAAELRLALRTPPV